MSYTLGQVDPAPPPMRPVSWPMILGWTAVVGVTLAVFNGTISLGGGRVRANRRTSRRRSSRRRMTPNQPGPWFEVSRHATDPSGTIWRDHPRWQSKVSKARDGSYVVYNRERVALGAQQTAPVKAAIRRLKRNTGRRTTRNARPERPPAPYATLRDNAWLVGFGNGEYLKSYDFSPVTHAIVGWHTTKTQDDAMSFVTSGNAKATASKFLVTDDGAQVIRMNRRTSRRRSTRNTGRRSSAARPKPPKFSEMGVWQAVAAVRESGRPSEVAGVLPPGVAAKFKKLAPGLYKYGYGPKKGEVIVQFKNAGLKGAITSTRIGAKAVGEHHWVVDNFDPKFPVVIRGIDDRGGTYWRVEEFAKQHARVPVVARRKSVSR
jgi:hypothetical protein